MYSATSLQYKLLSLHSNLSSKFGVLPFIWNEEFLKYTFNRDICLYSIFTTIPLCALQYFFVVEETVRYILFSPQIELSGSLIYCLVWLILFAFQQANLYLAFYKCNELIALINSFKFYTTSIAGKKKNVNLKMHY